VRLHSAVVQITCLLTISYSNLIWNKSQSNLLEGIRSIERRATANEIFVAKIKPRMTAYNEYRPRHLCSGPQPAWDTRRGEMFSERGPDFLNYVQHIFPGGAKIFLGGDSPPWLRACLCYYLAHCKYDSTVWQIFPRMPPNLKSKKAIDYFWHQCPLLPRLHRFSHQYDWDIETQLLFKSWTHTSTPSKSFWQPKAGIYKSFSTKIKLLVFPTYA